LVIRVYAVFLLCSYAVYWDICAYYKAKIT